jgi:hypothetical protein
MSRPMDSLRLGEIDAKSLEKSAKSTVFGQFEILISAARKSCRRVLGG